MTTLMGEIGPNTDVQPRALAPSIESVQIDGLHLRHDLKVELHPGLNIIYAKNGMGKTTFLHVLTNLLEQDIERFCHLRFTRIKVSTSAGREVELHQDRTSAEASVRVLIDGVAFPPLKEGDETPDDVRISLAQAFGSRPVYLPAFRSVLEAISGERSRAQLYNLERDNAEFRRILVREEANPVRRTRRIPMLTPDSERSRSVAYKTTLCREWFGSFVPIVRCPSLWEVASELVSEAEQARWEVAQKDRSAFSSVFVDVLRAVLGTDDSTDRPEVATVLDRIRRNLTALQETQVDVPEYIEISSLVHEKSHNISGGAEASVARILEVYDHAVSERNAVQREAFSQLRTLQDSVNKFLVGKRLDIKPDQRVAYNRVHRGAGLVRLGRSREADLSALSSGERHVLTLLFSATHMSDADGMVLIDEPELSLHVGWQRMILGELHKQAGDRQIIACTHAPEVSADHFDSRVRFRPTSLEWSDESGPDPKSLDSEALSLF